MVASPHWEDPGGKGGRGIGMAPTAAGLPRARRQKGGRSPTVMRGWLVFPPAGTVPLRLRRSPVFKRRTKHDSLPEPEGEPQPSSDAAGAPRCSLPLHPCRRGCWGYRRVSPPPTLTPALRDLSRCHVAGPAPRRAGGAAGWSGHRRRAAASPGTNCCECTRLSSRRPKTPGAGPGGASPGTVTPLHATVLFPIKPCKQARGAGVIGSRGAESRDRAQGCSPPGCSHGTS